MFLSPEFAILHFKKRGGGVCTKNPTSIFRTGGVWTPVTDGNSQCGKLNGLITNPEAIISHWEEG